MGKTEKIVVLGVLVVVVSLFVWSLMSDGAQAKTKDEGPESAARSAVQNQDEGGARSVPRDGGTTPQPRPGSGGERPIGPTDVSDSEVAGPDLIELEQSSGMLFHELELEPAVDPVPAASRTLRMQQGWDLVTTGGLEPTVDPSMMIHRPAEGATWTSLARDFYGDESKERLLRHYNEGMDEPGALILVPAKDDLGAAGTERVVVVLEGESLWGVAKRTLGSGLRWKEIYQANKDVITDPDFVAPGVQLRIPNDL